METEIAKLSSKGQVVIPQDIREKFGLKEGQLMAFFSEDGKICLKKIELPKIKKWKDAVKPFREAAEKSGFTRQDLNLLIAESKTR